MGIGDAQQTKRAGHVKDLIDMGHLVSFRIFRLKTDPCSKKLGLRGLARLFVANLAIFMSPACSAKDFDYIKIKVAYILEILSVGIILAICSLSAPPAFAKPPSPPGWVYYDASSSWAGSTCMLEGSFSVPWQGAWAGYGATTVEPSYLAPPGVAMEHPLHTLGANTAALDTAAHILSELDRPGLCVLGHAGGSSEGVQCGVITALGPSAQCEAAVISAIMAQPTMAQRGEEVTLVACHQRTVAPNYIGAATHAQAIQNRLQNIRVFASTEPGTIKFVPGHPNLGFTDSGGINQIEFSPVKPIWQTLDQAPVSRPATTALSSKPSFAADLLSGCKGQARNGLVTGVLQGGLNDLGVDPRITTVLGIGSGAAGTYQVLKNGIKNGHGVRPGLASAGSFGGGLLGGFGAQAWAANAGGTREQQEAAGAFGSFAGGFVGGGNAGVLNGACQVGALGGEYCYQTYKGTFKHGSEYWVNWWKTGYFASMSKCYLGR